MRRASILIAAFLFLTLSARAEQKNVQLLTNMSDFQLVRAMNYMRASLGVNCEFCHVRSEKGEWDFAIDTKDEKKTAREMIRMVIDINAKNFHNQPRVNCNTCHNGQMHPAAMPMLPQPVPPSTTAHDEHRPAMPAAKEILAKYVAAIGGEPARTKLSSPTRVSKGTRELAGGKSFPIEIYESGDSFRVNTTAADGTPVEQAITSAGGWARSKEGVRSVHPTEAENGRSVARMYAPFQPSLPEEARVLTKEKIGDHEAYVVGAQLDERTRERLWFDTTTGLLLRRLITTDGPIGRIPEQTDYDDYRDVSGVKVPFMVRVSLVDPYSSSTRHYTAIEFGAPVDEKLFAQPPAPPPAEKKPS